MPIITARAWVDADLSDVFDFFDDPANLARLTPPPVRIELVRVEPTPPRPGSVFEFDYGIGPIRRRWSVRLLERTADERFVDETIEGPLARFHHTHAFRRGRRGTWIHDRIDYHVGPDGLRGVALDALASLAMRGAFVVRHALARRLHARR
jgi:ligand-binding SRPBCC domain-containing protein